MAVQTGLPPGAPDATPDPDGDLGAAGAVAPHPVPSPPRPDVHARDRLRRQAGSWSPIRSWSSRSSPATRRSSTPARATTSCGRCSATNSLLVLDDAAAHEPAQAAAAALPRPADGRLRGDDAGRSPAREIESWPTGVPYQLRPRMQAMTLEIILETVFGVHGGERLGELREALRSFLDLLTDPRLLVPMLALGPDRIRSFPPFRRRVDRVAELIVAEIAERRARRRPRGARRHPLAAGRRPPRGRLADERRRDPRRAPHPAGRRPRDDRDGALLGGRAADPPPRQAGAAARPRSRRARTPT